MEAAEAALDRLKKSPETPPEIPPETPPKRLRFNDVASRGHDGWVLTDKGVEHPDREQIEQHVKWLNEQIEQHQKWLREFERTEMQVAS